MSQFPANDPQQPPQPGQPWPAPPQPWPPGMPGGMMPYWTPQQAPTTPRVWTPFVVFITALVAAVGVQAIVLVALLYAPLRRGEPLLDKTNLMRMLTEPGAFLLLGATTPLTLGAVAICAAAFSRVRLVDRLRLGPSTASYLTYIPMTLGTLALSFALSTAHSLMELPQGESLPMITEMAKKFEGPVVLAGVLVIGVLPGIFEELLCRGYIQTRLRQRWGVALAIIITSILFGVMHLDPVQGSLAVLLGAWLGYLTERTGSIRPSIFCHFANNSLMVALIALAGGDATADPPRHAQMIMLGVATILFGGCVLWVALAMRTKGWPEPAPVPAPVYWMPPYAPHMPPGFAPPPPPPGPPPASPPSP